MNHQLTESKGPPDSPMVLVPRPSPDRFLRSGGSGGGERSWYLNKTSLEEKESVTEFALLVFRIAKRKELRLLKSQRCGFAFFLGGRWWCCGVLRRVCGFGHLLEVIQILEKGIFLSEFRAWQLHWWVSKSATGGLVSGENWKSKSSISSGILKQKKEKNRHPPQKVEPLSPEQGPF